MSGLVLNQPFTDRLPKALRDAAMHLALDQVRRDQHPEIVHHRIAVKHQRAGLGVDLHLGKVDAIREGPPVKRDLFAAVQKVGSALFPRDGCGLDQGQPQIGSRGTKAVVGKADGVHTPFLGQKLFEPRDHRGDSGPCCGALHRHRPGPTSAATLADAVAVTLDDLHLVRRDPGRLGHHAGIDAFMTLPVRLGTDIERGTPVFVQRKARNLIRVAKDRFDIGRDANAAKLAPGFA